MSTILIPARYASFRFPGKVLVDVCGKPMIVRVAQQCLKTNADRVVVVTDNDMVAAEVKKYSIDYVMSDPALPTGTDRIAVAALDINDDIIINVQGDEPFIPPALINSLIEQLKSEPELLMNTACTPFGVNDDSKNPAHVKVVLDKNNYAIYFSRAEIPFNRDNVECVRYKHIGIYGFRKNFLLKYSKMDKSMLEQTEMLEQLRALENGIKIKVVKTDYKSISIDTKEDLDRAVAYCRSIEAE